MPQEKHVHIVESWKLLLALKLIALKQICVHVAKKPICQLPEHPGRVQQGIIVSHVKEMDGGIVSLLFI